MLRKMYIDGSWVEAISGQTRDFINPYNRKIVFVATVAERDRKDAKKAIDVAQKVFKNGEMALVIAEWIFLFANHFNSLHHTALQAKFGPVFLEKLSMSPQN